MTESLRTLLRTRDTFTSREAREKGIHPSLLAYYVNQGILERISRGLYRNPAKDSRISPEWEDLVATALSIPNGVICLISALSLHEMTDEIPREHWIAVANERWRPKRKHARVLRFSNMTLGRTRIRVGTKTVLIFDRERTIIDAFRHLPIEVAIKALKAYVQTSDSHKPNYRKLNQYATQLRFDISPYVLSLTT